MAARGLRARLKRESVKEKVCRSCKRIFTGDACDLCGSSNFAHAYQGLLIVIDPDKSEIARMLNIKKDGSYALKI